MEYVQYSFSVFCPFRIRLVGGSIFMVEALMRRAI